jgi:glycosyltransferase involved in cell wall biosynthesis
MKIAYTSQYFPPLCTFGAENYAFHLAREIAREHEVCVITAGRDEGPFRFTEESYAGLTIHRVLNYPRKHPYRAPEIDEWVGTILQNFQPDLLHLHHMAGLSSNIPALAADRNIPCVYTLHDFWNLCSNYHLLQENQTLCPNRWKGHCAACDQHTNGLLNKNAQREGRTSDFSDKKQFYNERFDALTGPLHQARRIYCPSQYLLGKYREAGVPENRLVFSPYGMDHELLKDMQPTRHDPLAFGFIGSHSPHKGVHVLVEAFNQLEDTPTTLKLYGGAGVHQDAYQQGLREQCRNPNVEFAGHLPNTAIRAFYEQIDCLVVPSIWSENAPLVISESFMANTPVLCSDIGGMAEMVSNGQSGWHFPVGNAEALAEAIRNLANQPQAIDNCSFPAVRTIADDAAEKLADYQGILSH